MWKKFSTCVLANVWLIVIITVQCSASSFSILQHNINHKIKASPIEVKSNKFFHSDTGEQFFIKGIAYQPTRKEGEVFDNSFELPYIDPLAKPEVCVRDIEYLMDLGVNLVRVYQIDPTADHDECMSALSYAGIYVLLDLSEPETSINRNEPQWDSDIFDRYKMVIDSMHKYDNVLGFFAGNEVANSKVNTDSAPMVKAAIRDVKAYIKDKGYRSIPVGYASNDDAEIRSSLSKYLVCGEKESTADFLGINMYEWCGYSTYATSGYRDRTLEFRDFSTPIFFSEYGCNNVVPRPFTEVEALYGTTMSKVWSGGIAYEYFQGFNNYGLVEVTAGGQVQPLKDFEYLKLRLNSIKPRGVHKDSVTEEFKTVKCEEPDDIWKASSYLPQKPDSGKCECLQATLSCIVTPFAKVNEHELLAEICSQTDCSAIENDGAKGIYGQYADCGIKQRISYALNKYYLENGANRHDCSFDGRAVLIPNSDDFDLAHIFAADGRTCNEAIGNVSSVERQTPKKKTKALETHEVISPSNNHHEARNTTRVLKSGSSPSNSKGMEYVAVCIITAMGIFVTFFV